MPKHKDPIWLNFNCTNKPNNTGKWATCKKCKKELQGIPQRLKEHTKKCAAASSEDDCEIVSEVAIPQLNIFQNQEEPQLEQSTSHTVGTKRKSEPSIIVPLKKKSPQPVMKISKDADVVVTSKSYAEQINQQIGKYFYATNTPFNHASHEEFLKMFKLMRPGYEPPSPYQLGGSVLNTVYDSVLEECKGKFHGETVSMSLDGWSNIHNEPLVCCSLMTQHGQSILVDTIDTSGHSHMADYLKELAVTAIKKCESSYGVKVKSFVTDNTGNVAKMRRELEATDDVDIIQYGCSAHILNLLAQDVQIPGIKDMILKVIKYFRNKHLPAAWYKASKGKKLVMPQEVRWNSVFDSIQSYLDNRGILVQVCQDHKDHIDQDIFNIVNDTHIMESALNFLNRLTPIAVALDRVQQDSSTISIAVEVWHQLNNELQGQPQSVLLHFLKRRNMALGPAHFLANICDHRFRGLNLTVKEKESAFTYLNSINPEYIPIVMALTTASLPFPSYLFGKQFRSTPPITWWKSVQFSEPGFDWENLKDSWLSLCEKLLTAVASTAGLERIFSSFGLVQSKLRNRLGNEKANKLTFLFKYMNQNLRKKKTSLSWVWESEAENILEEHSSDLEG